MAEVQSDNVVSRDYRGPDRRRGGILGKLERGLIKTVRSRWLAMFVVAFAVSYGFQQVDNIGERRLERQQKITLCVIDAVAKAQRVQPHLRTNVGSILEVCEERRSKE